jgi:alpha-glucoside transport system substrate-binding protein
MTDAPSSAATTGATTGGGSAAHDVDASHVRVLGMWTGPEYDSFVSVKSTWEKDTGGVVDWEATRDPSASLDDSARTGDAPDIAILPNLGLVQRLARQGRLLPLDSVLDMTRVRTDYAQSWLDLGSLDGKLYGIFYKVSDKSTVWYDPAAFTAGGYRVPTTWQDTIALANDMVADGRTPFSIAAASGPAIGWPLTDWVAQIVLGRCGPASYDKWVAADIAWTDPCIAASFRMFLDIVRSKGYVRGGTEGILTTSDSAGTYPVYATPPGAYMYYLASFAQAFIAEKYPQLRPGQDYRFFPFPTIDPRFRGAITIGADVIVLLRDTPAAREFLTYFAGAPAQQEWIELGGFTSVNRSVAPGSYADPVARAVAEHLTTATVTRFSAGDMMPAALQHAWWRAMVDLVKDPRQLDSRLAALTQLARAAS